MLSRRIISNHIKTFQCTNKCKDISFNKYFFPKEQFSSSLSKIILSLKLPSYQKVSHCFHSCVLVRLPNKKFGAPLPSCNLHPHLAYLAIIPHPNPYVNINNLNKRKNKNHVNICHPTTFHHSHFPSIQILIWQKYTNVFKNNLNHLLINKF